MDRSPYIDYIQKVGGLSVDTYLEFSTDPHTAASGKILLPELSRDAIQEIYRSGKRDGRADQLGNAAVISIVVVRETLQ